MNIGILGLGEVGSAIKQLCAQKYSVFGRTRHIDELTGQSIDLLHVCIPYTQDFESIVVAAITELKPKLVIIDSTIKPGTSQSIYNQTQIDIVHAPINGIHPHLYKYLKKFTKPLGATSETAYQLAKQHFEELGVPTVKFDSPFETELAKVLCTTYYTWNILYEKWVHEISNENNANFDQVYTQWNALYNQGYQKSKPNVRRPVLRHMPGPIGGHCLLPNLNILKNWLNDDFINFMLEKNSQAK